MKWVLVLVLGTAGCTFITPKEHKLRLDGDEDGMPYPKDCNDNDDRIQGLDAWDGHLGCGDVMLVDNFGGKDDLNVVECDKVNDPRNSGVAKMTGSERIWAFTHEVPTDVVISPVDLVVEDLELWAIRGRYCDDFCTTETFGELSFRAEANELWFVIVSTEDLPVDSIPLAVDCLADI